MPCPIDANDWVEDTQVVSSMRVGMTGIFMPIKYDKTSYREENGLIFDENAYKSIASAASFEDIEQYVIKMIE